MKTSTSLWDALFGKRVTLNLPTPDGGERQVTVTKKWIAKMEREGKIEETSSTLVKVNILGPPADDHIGQASDMDELMQALTQPVDLHLIEHWVVGEKVSQKQCDNFLDPETGELYAIRQHKDGEAVVSLVQRALWVQTRSAMAKA